MFGLLAIKRFGPVFLFIPLIVGVIVSHISTLALYARPWCVLVLWRDGARGPAVHGLLSAAC